jgi:AraC-like DNA-binding protein
MFAFAPGEIHTGYPIDAAGYGYKVMYLDVGRLNFDEEYILDVDAIAHNLKQPVANLGLAGVVSVFHDSIALPSTRLTRGILMSRVLTELSALVTPAALSKSDEPLAARRMKDYIDTHYAEEISLSVLTTVSQISRARCIEAFTKAYGVPPHAYQIQLRIERSKIALRGPDRLSDVALAVGFYDQSHFTNQFKRYVGVSPGAYKRHLASV